MQQFASLQPKKLHRTLPLIAWDAQTKPFVKFLHEHLKSAWGSKKEDTSENGFKTSQGSRFAFYNQEYPETAAHT